METFAISQVAEQLLTYGRTFRQGETLYFNWSGSTVEFCFRGTCLSARFRADCGYEVEGMPDDPNAPKRATWPWVAVFLDDEKTPVRTFQISSGEEAWLLYQSAEETVHRVRLTKLTENAKGILGISGFYGEGVFLNSERKTRRRMEFVGDSITCGYGNLSKDPSRHFYSAEEDATQAYGPLAARALGMEYSLISYSGITALRHPGWMIPNSIDEIYAYTDYPLQKRLGLTPEKWDFSQETNDYVVINLGTNDCFGILFSGTPGELERFPQGYEALLVQIRACNGPKAHIVCALGTMNYYLYHDIVCALESYRAKTGDSNLSLLRFSPISPTDGLGADGHPSLETHKKMAKELTDHIRSLKMKP